VLFFFFLFFQLFFFKFSLYISFLLFFFYLFYLFTILSSQKEKAAIPDCLLWMSNDQSIILLFIT